MSQGRFSDRPGVPGKVAMSLLAAFACAAMSLPAAAALYKWTDTNGRVVYSDQPPTGNVKYETVSTSGAAPSNPEAVREMAQKDLELKRRAKDAAEKDQKAEAQRIETAKRVEMCQRAQSNVKQLSADQVALVRYNEKGEMVYVDDAQRRKERADIEAWMKANCAGLIANN